MQHYYFRKKCFDPKPGAKGVYGQNICLHGALYSIPKIRYATSENMVRLVSSNMFQHSSKKLLLIVPRPCCFLDLFCYLYFVFVCHTVLSVYCSIADTCSDGADLVALLYVMFSYVFSHFPYHVLGHVWYLIVFFLTMTTLRIKVLAF